MSCQQEECPMWDGDTCPCETFGLDPDDLPKDGVFTVTVPDRSDEEKMETAMDDYARNTTAAGTWIFDDEEETQ